MPTAAIGAILGGAGGLAGGIGGLVGRGASSEKVLPPETSQEGDLQNSIYGADPNAAERARLEKIVADGPLGRDGVSTPQDYFAAQKSLEALGPVKRQGGLMDEMTKFANLGPGAQDISKSLTSQRGLSELLSQMAKSGGLPSADDITTSNGLAGGLFNARRTALNQTFTDLNTSNAREAARLGRDALDPILAAKLGTTKARMSDSLQAEQSDFANRFALNLPGQRLGYATQAAGVDAGLAEQASRNRATLLGLGSQLLNSERGFRLGQAGQTVNQNGSIGDVIGGAFGGVGAGLKLWQQGQQAFGGGGQGGGGFTSSGGPGGYFSGGPLQGTVTPLDYSTGSSFSNPYTGNIG